MPKSLAVGTIDAASTLPPGSTLCSPGRPAAHSDPLPATSSRQGPCLERLPYELLCEIVAHADRSAALALAQCCQTLRQAVRPLLWQTVIIRAECPLAAVHSDRLRAFLKPREDVAAAVRCFVGLVGAGELTTGEEARALGRLVRLLPNLQHLDVRADSMGRYQGRIDPLLDELAAWPGQELDGLVLKGLVYSIAAVGTFLAVHPGLRRVSLALTRLLIGTTQAADFEHEIDLGVVPDFLWDRDAFTFPAATTGLLSNATHAIGSLVTLASLFGNGLDRWSLRALDIQLRVPQSSADLEAIVIRLETVLQHTPALVSLRLRGESSSCQALVEAVMRQVPRLASLDLTDSVNFALEAPTSPLQPDQLRRLPSLHVRI